MAFDLIISGGRLVDGSGSPPRVADVAISGQKIVSVGDLAGCSASRKVNAEGQIVCPGFIDIHAHGEEQLLSTPGAEAKVLQGITTMVGGNCGISAAPVCGPLASFVNASNIFPGVEVDWSTFAELFDRIETGGTAINLLCLVGNATLRACVLGMDARKPNLTEQAEMERLCAQAMEQGAIGFSTGLVYAPGSYADTAEITALTRVAARSGGLYATHVRGMARPIIEAVQEALEIGKNAGIPVQVSHLNPGYPSWGRIQELIEMVEAARADGLDAAFDTLVYPQSTFSGGSLLPNWANEGGMLELLKRLAQPETRQRIKTDTLRYGDELGGSVASCLIQEGKWNQLWLMKPERFKLKNLAELAEFSGKTDPFDALLDLILEEKGAVSGISQPYCQDDVDQTVKHPLGMFETDDRPVTPEGRVAPWHRRGYGSFAHVFEQYVRERGLLSCEEAVRKSTSLPAWRLGLTKRGLVEKGYYADLVVFDPGSIRDESSDEEPAKFPTGIDYVIVNGETVVEQGHPTGALPGKVIRHTQSNQEFVMEETRDVSR